MLNINFNIFFYNLYRIQLLGNKLKGYTILF